MVLEYFANFEAKGTQNGSKTKKYFCYKFSISRVRNIKFLKSLQHVIITLNICSFSLKYVDNFRDWELIETVTT
jgi:hypothetical protein